MYQKILKYKEYLALHLVVFIWGATGLVGDLLEMPSVTLTAYRMGIAAVFIAAVNLFIPKFKFTIRPKAQAKMLASGVLLAAYFWLFFESIKQSTVSIGLVCLAAIPLFVAMVNPLFSKKRIAGKEILLGLGSVVSLALVFSFELKYVYGIFLGLTSSLTTAIYFILTGMITKEEDPWETTMYQMFGGVFFIAIVYSIFPSLEFTFADMTDPKQLVGMIFLGIFASAMALSVYAWCLRSISTFSATMILNLEPIYGILMALAVYGEKEYMSAGFYGGSVLLMVCIALDSMPKLK